MHFPEIRVEVLRQIVDFCQQDYELNGRYSIGVAPFQRRVFQFPLHPEIVLDLLVVRNLK